MSRCNQSPSKCLKQSLMPDKSMKLWILSCKFKVGKLQDGIQQAIHPYRKGCIPSRCFVYFCAIFTSSQCKLKDYNVSFLHFLKNIEKHVENVLVNGNRHYQRCHWSSLEWIVVLCTVARSSEQFMFNIFEGKVAVCNKEMLWILFVLNYISLCCG